MKLGGLFHDATQHCDTHDACMMLKFFSNNTFSGARETFMHLNICK